jgi:hypothetical protein
VLAETARTYTRRYERWILFETRQSAVVRRRSLRRSLRYLNRKEGEGREHWKMSEYTVVIASLIDLSDQHSR